MARKKKSEVTKLNAQGEKSSITSTESESALEERAIKLVYNCKKESLDFYEEKFKSFNYFDRLYIKGAAKTNVPYGRANLELPLAFQQVEPFVSQMTETMLGETPYIAYTGRNSDDDPVAQELTDFTQYQLDCGGFLSSCVSWFRNLGKYGSAVMKINWETDSVEIENELEVPTFALDPNTGMPVQTGEYKTIVDNEDFIKHDGPVFYNCSLFDFFVPRSASSPNVQKMPWVIHRVYRSLDQILENPNYNRNRSKIKKLIAEEIEPESPTMNPGASREQSKRIEQEQKNPSKGSQKYRGKVEVLEYWGDFSFTKSESSRAALIVIAVLEDEKILLRLDNNPFKFKFKPFLMANDYPVEGEPYGYGELHHIKGLIEESTALRNARLDVANISLNRVWLVERQAGVNLRELYTAPNKIILTNDLQGIKPMDMGNVTPSSVNELARIDFDIQNTTEIINPRQDVSNVGAAFGSTATGVNFLAGKSNLRLMTKARLLQENFFKPLADMLNWFNRDFITDETYYRVAGDDTPNPYRTLPVDAFLTRVDFKPNSAPDKLTMEEKKGNMGYFLQTVGQIVKVKPDINIKFEELIKDIAKMSGFPHPDKYIGPPKTTVMQTPDGQMLDQKGQPVEVVPVDETGNPVEQVPPQPPQGVSA